MQYNHDTLICVQNLLNRGTLSPLHVEIFSIIWQTKCPYPGPEKRHRALRLTGDCWILNWKRAFCLHVVHLITLWYSLSKLNISSYSNWAVCLRKLSPKEIGTWLSYDTVHLPLSLWYMLRFLCTVPLFNKSACF